MEREGGQLLQVSAPADRLADTCQLMLDGNCAASTSRRRTRSPTTSSAINSMASSSQTSTARRPSSHARARRRPSTLSAACELVSPQNPYALAQIGLCQRLDDPANRNCALSQSGAVNYASAAGGLVECGGYGTFSYFPPELYMLACTYM